VPDARRRSCRAWQSRGQGFESRRGQFSHAEKALTVQIDEQRNPRTTATVEQLLTEHFDILEVEPSTLATYRTLAANWETVPSVWLKAVRQGVGSGGGKEIR
jgi:hypothetical protein